MRGRTEKPVIVVTTSHFLDKGDAHFSETAREVLEQSRLNACYYDSVTAAGGLPLLAPPLGDPADASLLVALADGVLLTGGPDLRGETFGEPTHPKAVPMTERRQAFELAFARAALDRDVPIFAICLGIQTLNVAAGGTLYQHLPEEVGTEVQHSAVGVAAAHAVVMEPGSRVARLTGTTRLMTNSHHHQAVKRVARGFTVTARGETDGVIEAIETTDPNRFILAVQWHPERLSAFPEHLALFSGLVEAAKDRVHE